MQGRPLAWSEGEAGGLSDIAGNGFRGTHASALFFLGSKGSSLSEDLFFASRSIGGKTLKGTHASAPFFEEKEVL